VTDGRLAIVLHSHMPYVEGFGTWPFGEEWLWEAIATSYLPLLDVLADGAPVTLGLTPVLCDQLEAPGAVERCLAFLREIRPASHALDVAEATDPAVAAELERSAAEYASASDRLPTDLLAALAPYAAWTSAAWGAKAASRSAGSRSAARAYSSAPRSSAAATASSVASATSSACDAGRISRRKARQRSMAPGASSWSHSTGVRLSVTGVPPSSTSSSGRYDVAIASHSHSSPNGHVPKPST